MEVKTQSSLFGSKTRTRVLLVLQVLGESYARELSRVLEVPVSVVQKAIGSLEKDGLIAGRITGRTRLYKIDQRFFASTELRSLLSKLAEPEADLKSRLTKLRKRPRRAGKPSWL